MIQVASSSLTLFRRAVIALFVALMLVVLPSTSQAASTQLLVVGCDTGCGQVRIYDTSAAGAGRLITTVQPFGAEWTGGVRVATGDIDNDGNDDIVVGAGPGGAPHVKVYEFGNSLGTALPTLQEMASFNAFVQGFTGGVWVAAGDVDGDNFDEVIVGAGAGGTPHVRTFDVTNAGVVTELAGPAGSFFAYNPAFTGGVRVASANFGGIPARDEIVTGAGPGGGPHVKVFQLDFTGNNLNELASFFAYTPFFTGGVYVAAGNIDDDLQSEVVTGAGAGGGPHVRTFDISPTTGLATEEFSFFALPESFTGGVRVGVASPDMFGSAEIVTAPGPNAGGESRVKVFGEHAFPNNGPFEGRFEELMYGGLAPFGSNWTSGLYVAP